MSYSTIQSLSTDHISRKYTSITRCLCILNLYHFSIALNRDQVISSSVSSYTQREGKVSYNTIYRKLLPKAIREIILLVINLANWSLRSTVFNRTRPVDRCTNLVWSPTHLCPYMLDTELALERNLILFCIVFIYSNSYSRRRLNWNFMVEGPLECLSCVELNSGMEMNLHIPAARSTQQVLFITSFITHGEVFRTPHTWIIQWASHASLSLELSPPLHVFCYRYGIDIV